MEVSSETSDSTQFGKKEGQLIFFFSIKLHVFVIVYKGCFSLFSNHMYLCYQFLHGIV